ncbi:MAG: DNA primase [Deltaproteobacteria bacterium]|nr:DNA primase [Deltaproteobacteria bacterium]
MLDRVSIEEVVGEYVELKKSGASYKGKCPFHDETSPSFYVHPDRGFYYCFGCRKGGDAIKFLEEMEGRSFMESLRDLASRAGVELPAEDLKGRVRGREDDVRRDRHMKLLEDAAGLYHRVLIEHPDAGHARDYLERRSISQETIKRFRLGYAPNRWDFLVEHLRSRKTSPGDAVDVGLLRPRRSADGYYDWFRRRVMFPILSPGGKVIGFSGRLIDTGDGDAEEAKYINTPETPYYRKGEVIYGLYQAAPAIRRGGRAYIVEGNFDLVAMSQAGFENVVAPMGTAVTAPQVSRLGRLGPELVFVFDGDKAGRAAAIRAFDVVAPSGRSARVAILAADEDPDSLLRKSGVHALQEVLDGSIEMGRFVIRHAARSAGDSDGLKVEVVRKLWATLGRVPDPMLRDLYLKHVAGEFGIDESLIRRHVGLGSGTRRDRRPGSVGEPVADDTVDVAPELLHLLGAVLDFPDLAAARADEIGEIQLDHPGLEGLLHIIKTTDPGDVGRNLRETLTSRGDESYKRWALERLVSPLYLTREEAEEAFDDCHRKIVRRRIERRLAEVKCEIDEAIRAGDTDRFNELAREQTKLNRMRVRRPAAPGEVAG